ncbi:DUF3023 domain-containing protein [Ehrlichia minasensis]|uniref:DUF3023 domain-containing protein n=1 Tax=Ehrlichia minasensis TaxID=1242993 RepID=UPI0030B81110
MYACICILVEESKLNDFVNDVYEELLCKRDDLTFSVSDIAQYGTIQLIYILDVIKIKLLMCVMLCKILQELK